MAVGSGVTGLACAARLAAGGRAVTSAQLVRALPATAHHAVTLRRKARTEQALGEPCLWDATHGLGLCGDWCLGARVEAAWVSGDALAGRILSGDAAAS